MRALGLFDAQDPPYTWATRDVLSSWDAAVVQRLVHEEEQYQANGPHDGANPKGPIPRDLVNNERRDHRSEVRT